MKHCTKICSLDFFKTKNPKATKTVLRALLHRAGLYKYDSPN